jgi:glycosyltransferase involved in cell wall biosynthesis
MSDMKSLNMTQHVAILMGTYNGARFLEEQLSSIEWQQHKQWALYVSDDGSQDGTLELLHATQKRWPEGRIKLLTGPGRGFVANFLSLVCNTSINAKFYAWSDQDDVWCDNKLKVALAWLSTIPKNMPALYCGRTELICEAGVRFGLSPLFTRPPHFANALVQNIGGGNTMVFNQAARTLLLEAGERVVTPSHDWWTYQLVTGAGGAIRYDPEPRVLYRQHSKNLIGSNSNWLARLERMRMVFQGRFSEWNGQSVCALEAMQHRFSAESRLILGLFKEARNSSFFRRVINCRRSGVYRQTFLGNLGLILAICLKKI